MPSQHTHPNKTLFQTFEWHTSSQSPSKTETHVQTSHYARLLRILPSLRTLGVTTLWLPPGCKANTPESNGYDCYDLWDLGEYDSKFARSTKWGSVEELRDLINAAHANSLGIIWDAVLNHKASGDATEECWAVEVDPNDRRVEICPPKKIVAWLKYEFPGRGTQRSSFMWRSEHFNGTDWDDSRQRHAIYKLIDDPATYPKPSSKSFSLQRLLKSSNQPPRRPGKGWADDVSKMHGNYDYLLLANIDHKHPAVREDMLNWGEWMLRDTAVDGFRLDAVQHFSYGFSREWIAHVQTVRQQMNAQPAFVVGEVWTGDTKEILTWLDAVGYDTYAYDSPLVYNFSRLSEDFWRQDESADLRRIAQGSLVACRPRAAVTIVSNHDTQQGQASFVPMDAQLKVLFYAFILLRIGGQPCVFWGDLFGIQGPHPEPAVGLFGKRSILADLVLARQLFAYGEQSEIFGSADCLAWSRSGTHDRPGCVVLVGLKDAQISARAGAAGETWMDILQAEPRRSVILDRRGHGLFVCHAKSAAVFVKQNEALIKQFPTDFDITMAV